MSCIVVTHSAPLSLACARPSWKSLRCSTSIAAVSPVSPQAATLVAFDSSDCTNCEARTS